MKLPYLWLGESDDCSRQRGARSQHRPPDHRATCLRAVEKGCVCVGVKKAGSGVSKATAGATTATKGSFPVRFSWQSKPTHLFLAVCVLCFRDVFGWLGARRQVAVSSWADERLLTPLSHFESRKSVLNRSAPRHACTREVEEKAHRNSLLANLSQHKTSLSRDGHTCCAQILNATLMKPTDWRQRHIRTATRFGAT